MNSELTLKQIDIVCDIRDGNPKGILNFFVDNGGRMEDFIPPQRTSVFNITNITSKEFDEIYKMIRFFEDFSMFEAHMDFLITEDNAKWDDHIKWVAETLDKSDLKSEILFKKDDLIRELSGIDYGLFYCYFCR